MPEEVDGSGEIEDGSNLPSANSKLPVSPTIAKLNALPKRRYGNVTWPEGTPQPLTQEIATHFFSLMATSDCSLVQLLRDHPELPPFRQLDFWRANNKNGFAERWRETRKAQAHFLVQKCLDLQKSVNAQNAHQVRVKFDILRWVAAKFHPSVYAEKPLQAPIANRQYRCCHLTRTSCGTSFKTRGDSLRARSQRKDSQWRHGICSKAKSENALAALWSGTLTLYQRLAHRRRLAVEGKRRLSEKVGHWNCVILRESCKCSDLHFPL